MQALLDDHQNLETIIEKSTPVEDPENGTFNLQTLVFAGDGEAFSVDGIADVIKDSERQKRTYASVLKERFADAQVTTIISPGDGVVTAMPRSPRKKK